MSNLAFALMLAGSFVAGLLLGFVYFYGLWLTIRKLPTSKRPTMLALGSFFGRTAAAVAGVFLLIQGGYWQNGIVCVAGIVVMRMFLVKKISLNQAVDETTGEK